MSDATVVALAGDKPVATAHSDGAGRFAFSAPAGHYSLHVTAAGVPRPATQPVTVTAGTVTHVTVAMDSGLR